MIKQSTHKHLPCFRITKICLLNFHFISWKMCEICQSLLLIYHKSALVQEMMTKPYVAWSHF